MTATPSVTPTPIIHIVDDDNSFRRAVSRLLEAAGYTVHSFGSAGEFLMARPEEAAGCILLDIQMPGPSGLELQEALVKQGVTLPIIFLTGHGDIPMSVQAMKSGAVDFLTKPVKRKPLLRAVEAALARDREHRQSQERDRNHRDCYESLTPREREVFKLVTAGLLNKQIAAELGTSERTIKAHRAHIMEKMQVVSLAELVRIATELRIS